MWEAKRRISGRVPARKLSVFSVSAVAMSGFYIILTSCLCENEGATQCFRQLLQV